MTVGAGALAIVAADAEFLVNEEDVRRLADAVLDEEARDRGIEIDDAAEARLFRLDEIVQRLTTRHVLLRTIEQSRLVLEQPAEGGAVDPDHLRLDRGADGGGAAAAV